MPTEDEIEWAVKRLCNNRSRGLSGMQVEHLKRWITKAWKAAKDMKTAVGKEEEEAEMMTTERARPGMSEAQKGTESESDNWTRVVDLIQLAFRERKLAEEATW